MFKSSCWYFFLPDLAALSSCEPIDSLLYCGRSRRWRSQADTASDSNLGSRHDHVTTEMVWGDVQDSCSRTLTHRVHDRHSWWRIENDATDLVPQFPWISRLQLFMCDVFAGVGTWTLPDERVATDVAEVSPACCLRVLFLSGVCCNEAIVFNSSEKTIEAKMMKAGGTEIGKTLAEKSRGLFSANDWQCKT